MHRISLRYLMFALWWVCGGTLLAQTSPFNGFCWQGAVPATVQGLKSTNKLQGIIPSCTITVYDTGTTNRATLFASPSGTPLANPFTGTVSGQFLFYAISTGSYDVVLTGGIPPNTYASPVTLVGWSVGGGGSSTLPCDYGITTAGVITCGAPMTLPGVSTGSVEIGSETGLGFVKYDAAAGGGALRIFGPDSMTAIEDVTVPDSNYVAGAYCNDGAGNLSWGNCPPGTAGAITEIQAGAGLSGGGNSGSVILALENLSTTVNGQVCALGDSCTVPTEGLSGMTAGQVPVAATASTITSSVAASTTVNGETCALGSTCTIPTGSGSLSGMTAGQVAVAASASTVTSSVAASTTVNGQACALGGSCTVAATGTTVNVNGSAVANPNFNSTTPAVSAGYTPVTFDVSGSSVRGQVLSPYNPPNTTYIAVGESDNMSADQEAHPVASAVSCNGTTCTLTVTTSTSSPNWQAGGWILFNPELGAWSPSCLNQTTAQIVTNTGTALTFSETANTGHPGCTGVQTGTGGEVYSMRYSWPFQVAATPLFSGHGTMYNFSGLGYTTADVATQYPTYVHPLSPAVTGNPGFYITSVGRQDTLGCTAAATIKTNIAALWALAHADSFTVVAVDLMADSTTAFGCVNDALVQDVNDWMKGQKCNQTSRISTGQCWDQFVDIHRIMNSAYDAVYFNSDHLHPSQAGQGAVAAEFIRAMAAHTDVPYTGLGGMSNTPIGVNVSGAPAVSGDGQANGLAFYACDNALWASGGDGGCFGWGISSGATPHVPFEFTPEKVQSVVRPVSASTVGRDTIFAAGEMIGWSSAAGLGPNPLVGGPLDKCFKRLGAGLFALGTCTSTTDVSGELDLAALKVGGVPITSSGGLSGMTAGQVPVAATATTATSSVAASTTVNGQTCALGSTCTVSTSSGLSGMTAGQVPVAATASTATSSVAASTSVNGQTCALGGSCTVTAAQAVSVTWNIATGAAASPAANYLVAPVSGAVTHCYWTTTASDGSTDLTFNVKFNNANIINATSCTVTHGAAAKAIATCNLTGGTATVTQGQLWELDITAGTSSWTGALQCY